MKLCDVKMWVALYFGKLYEVCMSEHNNGMSLKICMFEHNSKTNKNILTPHVYMFQHAHQICYNNNLIIYCNTFHFAFHPYFSASPKIIKNKSTATFTYND